MAGPAGLIEPLEDALMGASGPGAMVGQQEVAGRQLGFNPTNLQPQFADQFFTGRPANIQTMVRPYDPPVAFPSRPARMPRAFGLGIQRWVSVSQWPFLWWVRDNDRTSWVGMTGVRLPKWSTGWGEPRKNIVDNQSMPYGDLVSLYPGVYAEYGATPLT